MRSHVELENLSQIIRGGEGSGSQTRDLGLTCRDNENLMVQVFFMTDRFCTLVAQVALFIQIQLLLSSQT